MGEDELVRRLVADLPQSVEVVTGPGDDCAVVQPVSRGRLQLLKTDCVVEGVHFLKDTPPEKVGWKALARVVSDIASMGGTPQHALVTLVLPPEQSVAWVESLYTGLRLCAARYGVSIVGGETARGGGVVISVSLTGWAPARQVLRRDGARAGDAIFVTGTLGGSIRGRHLDFEPRVAEAQWLAGNFRVQAMMDLSDGLARDLPRMAAASGVGFVLEEGNLPVNEGCTPDQAWSDGEDYELLFAVPSRVARKLATAWTGAFPALRLTCVGKFVTTGQGRMPSWQGAGWEHFIP
jgi:thiamine-monophosphate kinase